MVNPQADTRPAELVGLPADRIVDLDVREALIKGEEPFRQIMAAKDALPEGGVLRLRAIFEPVPLYAVMERYGYVYWTERLAADDWRVWFYLEEGTGTGTGTGEGEGEARQRQRQRQSNAGEGEGGDVVVLDVRGLEPPEPMVRTLEALESLPPGGTLVQLNVRVPQFLLPQLKARGFVYEVVRQDDALTRVVIRRA